MDTTNTHTAQGHDTQQANNTTPAPLVLLKVEEAAHRLSLSRTRLYQLIRDGHITTVRIGRLRRIPTTALTDFTNNLLHQPNQAAA